MFTIVKVETYATAAISGVRVRKLYELMEPIPELIFESRVLPSKHIVSIWFAEVKEYIRDAL